MKYLILNREGENNFNANISSPFVISNQSNISYNDFDWLIEIDIPSNSEILGQPVIINNANAKVFQNITVNNNSCNILLDKHNYKSFEYTFDTEGKYLLQFKCITPFDYSSTINETIYQYITKIMFINNWTPFCLNAPNGTELYLNITRDFDTYEKWGLVSINQFMPKLNKVVFHNEIQKIAPQSFESCAYLTSINLSELNKLTSIGSGAFAGTNLSSIIIPKNCTTLEINSFAYIKSKITELNLGNVQRINCAFTHCTFDNLDIEIPESLTYVENGIFYQSTGINSIKFKSSVPFESSTGFSNIFADAKTIYVPKGSRINYLNSGYCAAGFGRNAYDIAILNAQSSYDSYINRHPLLTYDPTFTYEDAIEYITVTNAAPGYQVSSIKNGYPAYQFWMGNYYGPVVYGLISPINGVSVPSNDASDEDVSSYWNQIIDIFKNHQHPSYKNINDEVVGSWKDLVLNENNEIKDKYKETDRKFNVDLFNADAYEIGLSLVKPWIDHYYNEKTDLETIELYNNKIRSEAQIEYDKVFNSLSKQHGFDKVIEY